MSLIHEKMIAVMKDIEPIAKAQYNSMQKFKFRGIDDIYNAIHGLLKKHEILLVPGKVVESKTESIPGKDKHGNDRITFRSVYTMQYEFMAADGSSKPIEVPGEGVDYADKATAKALSNALKYAVIQSFMIPTDETPDSDQDPISDHSQEIEKLQSKALYTLKNSNMPEKKKEAMIRGITNNNLSPDMLQKIVRGEV